MSKQSLVRIFFFVIIFIFAYLFYSQYREISRLRLQNITAQKNVADTNPKPPVIKDQLLSWKENNKALSDKSELVSPSPFSLLPRKQPVSPAIIQFIEEARLNITLPAEYNYSYIADFQVENIDVGVLYGTEGHSSIHIIGARYTSKNIPVIFQELSENIHLFVNLNKTAILGLAKSRIRSYSSRPGIKSIHLLEYKTLEKFIYASYLVREDLKGSYVILVSSSEAVAKKILLSILFSVNAL